MRTKQSFYLGRFRILTMMSSSVLMVTASLICCWLMTTSQAESVVQSTQPLRSATTEIGDHDRPISVIPHPFNDTLVIVLDRGSDIRTLSLQTLEYITTLNDYSRTDDYDSYCILRYAGFKEPTALFELSSTDFGIADSENYCVRRATYQNDDYFVTDIAGKCTSLSLSC